MMQTERKAHVVESVFIGLSAAALIAVVLANVIRVYVSPEVAVLVRAILFSGSWIAAIVWALNARRGAVLAWLGVLAGCGLVVAFCELFAGGISGSSLLQLFGAGGAGVGVALLIQKSLDGNHAAWAAGCAAIFGTVAAIWLALEPTHELWKMLPNNWEISKNLDYRWGIRMGQERARFLFDTPMEAGVVQWFLGALCLAAAMSKKTSALARGLLGSLALLLFASVALTYSRAGLVLSVMSIVLGALMSIRNRKVTVVALAAAVFILLIAAVAANRIVEDKNPAVKNVASIFDPAEEANRIRLDQFKKIGRELANTPWHGRGASNFVTYQEAPRMPQHESSPVGLIASFGIGGGALVLAFAWLLFRHRRNFIDTIVGQEFAKQNSFSRFVVFSVPPFAVYSIVAPILAGLMFGMLCFTGMGMLAIWAAPLASRSGKQ
ncbi:MAG TPA: O-antigen ligase family protein [Opitutaceae bacterium]|nr:O-antigen ligase family protein [Opitutaceae bacterium]